MRLESVGRFAQGASILGEVRRFKSRRDHLVQLAMEVRQRKSVWIRARERGAHIPRDSASARLLGLFVLRERVVDDRHKAVQFVDHLTREIAAGQRLEARFRILEVGNDRVDTRQHLSEVRRSCEVVLSRLRLRPLHAMVNATGQRLRVPDEARHRRNAPGRQRRREIQRGERGASHWLSNQGIQRVLREAADQRTGRHLPQRVVDEIADDVPAEEAFRNRNHRRVAGNRAGAPVGVQLDRPMLTRQQPDLVSEVYDVLPEIDRRDVGSLADLEPVRSVPALPIATPGATDIGLEAALRLLYDEARRHVAADRATFEGRAESHDRCELPVGTRGGKEVGLADRFPQREFSSGRVLRKTRADVPLDVTEQATARVVAAAGGEGGSIAGGRPSCHHVDRIEEAASLVPGSRGTAKQAALVVVAHERDGKDLPVLLGGLANRQLARRHVLRYIQEPRYEIGRLRRIHAVDDVDTSRGEVAGRKARDPHGKLDSFAGAKLGVRVRDGLQLKPRDSRS